MKERPIPFNGPMVRSVLAGTKTQTRRLVKPQPTGAMPPGWAWEYLGAQGWYAVNGHQRSSSLGRCPYGAPGDQLWVRETWTWNGGMSSAIEGVFAELWVTYAADGVKRTITPGGPVSTPKQPPRPEGEVYSLRDAPDDFRYDGENTYVDRLSRWWRRKIPAIHMPRWASRITLEVVAVRVERLQDISHEDALAEGVEALPSGEWRDYLAPHGDRLTPGGSYRTLWQSINGRESWDANPWVWVVEFRRLR